MEEVAKIISSMVMYLEKGATMEDMNWMIVIPQNQG